jgi:hypothetical protein
MEVTIMRLNPRLALIGAISVAALALAPSSAVARDNGDDHHGEHHHNGTLLKSGVVGSTPAPAGAVIFGVTPGGLPWVTDEGKVRVRSDGRIDVRIEGLVIPTPPQNGTNPVPALTATLFCNGAAAAVTESFPLSVPDGDARFRGELMLPEVCVAPVVLFNPNGNAAAYIAASGG